MPMNVICLSDKTDDAKYISPEQMLQEALREIESGELKGKKALLVVLNEEGGGFRPFWRNAGLKASEMVVLSECIKADALEFMGYG